VQKSILGLHPGIRGKEIKGGLPDLGLQYDGQNCYFRSKFRAPRFSQEPANSKETMMSEQANVQVVQAAYAAFKRGDIQTILNSLASDVEWIAPAIEPVAGTYHGRAGVTKFFERVNEISEFESFEPREYVAQGDRVIALGRYKAAVRSTGRVYDCDWAMAFTLTNGEISRFQEFTDTAAISAALPSASAAKA
jgi:uncharacterized protein